MNFRKDNMEKFATNKINEYLESLLHRRFKTVDDLSNAILAESGVCRVNLKKETEKLDHIEDDFLIGSLSFMWEFNGVSYSANFDIQIWYINDNYGNMYVTETTILELLDEQYSLKR